MAAGGLSDSTEMDSPGSSGEKSPSSDNNCTEAQEELRIKYSIAITVSGASTSAQQSRKHPMLTFSVSNLLIFPFPTFTLSSCRGSPHRPDCALHGRRRFQQ